MVLLADSLKVDTGIWEIGKKSKDDWAKTYVLDSAFDYFVKKET